ncbi:MAG: response regulator transcription factor [bacterium]
MAREHILVIEDEDDIRELIRYNLQREGYLVTEAANGENGIRIAREKHPDLLVLDLMLPGIDGFGVCRALKGDKTTSDLPIVIVTAKGEEPDIVTGLELGADDYITKPFSPRVLIARVRAVLRRRSSDMSTPDEASVIDREGLRIHPGRHEVLVDGAPVDLTYSEFRILHLMARRPGWVFTRYQIVDAVRGDDHPVSDRSVDVQIVGLRKKLGDCAHLVETVRGVGYRFKE